MATQTQPTKSTQSTQSPTEALSQAGVSIWLDDLSRERIVTGDLERLIAERNVVGVTTNPTIFANALAKGDGYREHLHALAEAGTDLEPAVFEIITDDVRTAADVLRPTYDATGGVDGRVSIEGAPGLAHDTAGTIAQAKELWATVDRPNVMIKIPATIEGLDAITATIAAGISVRSVASFFVSRVDTEIDKRLTAIGTDEALALKSKAGIANAQLAYELYEQVFGGERASALLDAGANRQRPLWASTGVKDPSLPDTLYVTELVAPGVVNTMPEKTLEATFDHGEIRGDTVTTAYAEAGAVLDALAKVGVDYDDVTAVLEREGVEKFSVSWDELLDTVRVALEAAR